ncbi:hypothetical protein MRB53_036998 [Persea americana]|nr:hypothetical protein MRB53_036998 [Persea americana]
MRNRHRLLLRDRLQHGVTQDDAAGSILMDGFIVSLVQSGCVVATDSAMRDSTLIRLDSRRHNLQLASRKEGPDPRGHQEVAEYEAKHGKPPLDDWSNVIHGAPSDDPSEPQSAARLVNNLGASDDKQSREDTRALLLAQRARHGDYDEELITEQLARNRVFLTEAGLQTLRSSFVIVVGCGGVGSHAAAALARSGVGRIRLIDFDQVSLSSLNRHSVATLADVGTPKVECLKKRLEQIAPWIQFDCRNELFAEAAADTLLESWTMSGVEVSQRQSPSFVLDCIDNIPTKVALLAFCHARSIPCISSMGAATKSSPTHLAIADISATTDDPLSRATRRLLRLNHNIATSIPCVFSTEKPGPGKAALLPLPDEEFEKGNVADLGPLAGFRARILPVLGTMPALFGITIANYVICSIASYPVDKDAGSRGKNREKLYDAILTLLQGGEERLARAQGLDARGLKVPLNQDDVGYLVEEVWRGRSAISGLGTRLALVRWKPPGAGKSKELDAWVDISVPGQKASRVEMGELVCMTKEEMLRHEKEVLLGGKSVEELYSPSVVEYVAERMEEEKRWRQWR